MMVRTFGLSRTSSRCPGAETKMRPLPHCRVQIAGAVTGRFQASQGRTSWVVVASTSLYSSLQHPVLLGDQVEVVDPARDRMRRARAR